MVYSLSRALVRLILRAFFGFRVEGSEHEPRSGAVIVVSNHLSDLDGLVVAASVRRRAGFMAKHELFTNPLLRWWITACGAFPVRRGAPDRQALRTALGLLHQGGALIMFPEGTRGHDRTLRPPEPGAAMLAMRTGAVILPVALLGTDEALPRDTRRLRRARIRAKIGAPLTPSRVVQSADGHSEREAIETLGRLYMAEIGRLMA